jgi:choline trimethylamine-lyase
MNDITGLRTRMLRGQHGRHRILMPEHWSTGHLDVSLPERKALALKLMLERMPVAIEPEERIVGTRTVFGRKCEDQEGIEDPSTDVTMFAYPSYMTDEERGQYKETYGVVQVPEGVSKGHYVAGYDKVLRLGFGGIREKALQRIDAETDPEKRAWLNAVCLAYEGASCLAHRYADLAVTMAKNATGERVDELLRIASVCRHVAEMPPRDLYEALQLFWFAHLVTTVENHSLLSFGRFDQYMERFWETCPPDEAEDLLHCVLIKLNDQADIRQGEGHYGSDNLMLSGLKPDGHDATNAVTWACLDALDRLRLPNPMFNMRLHQYSPTDLLRRACDLATQGLGQLAFYNDDAVVPALCGAGFPEESARDYALDACQDILIDGRSDFFLGGHFSMTDLLLKTLETLDDRVNFDALMAAYRHEISRTVGRLAENYRATLTHPSTSPLPFLSGTLDDCVGKGLDVTQGGLKYRDKGMFVGSPVNAVNSLAAIRKVVYDNGTATLKQVKDALRDDYASCEPLRLHLLSAPKWGNDDPYVDLIGKEILEFACHEIQKHWIDEDARFLSGIHQPHQVTTGANLGATPDGRRAGEPLPVTLSPVNGTERQGPTAVIRSVTRIDPLVCQWNHALILSFHSSTMQDDSGAERFEAMLKTYFALGGIQLEFNVIDVETLRAAQRDPEEYEDLVVRIWGFCARFVDLKPEYQEDLIARTTHSA